MERESLHTPSAVNTTNRTTKTAIAMVVVGGIDLLQSPWLLAKIGALGLYIVLGSVALKRATTRTGQAAAGLAALATVGWIVATAVGKQPWLP